MEPELYFRRLGFRAMLFGVGALLLTGVVYWTDVFQPGIMQASAIRALVTGATMWLFPGDVDIDPRGDFNSHWREARWTTKLVWLVGFVLGVLGFFFFTMSWLVATDGARPPYLPEFPT